jgi:amidophosphoribosyltransferase
MIKWPCFLGIDTPTQEQLIATKHSLDSMRKIIGCDYLGFLSLKNLINCCGGENKFCSGCFTGKYPTKGPK